MNTTLEDPKYLILLALAGGPSHGLSIQATIIADTVGVHVGLSSIYASLKVLLAHGWIEELDLDSTYRKSYQLTRSGARRLELAAELKGRTALVATERLRKF